MFGLARDVDGFRDALQYFDLGAQNWLYADLKGTIAYFTNAEVPVREDLQAGPSTATRRTCCATAPAATSGCPWNPQPNQALPYEIVPFTEMPVVVDPPAGFVGRLTTTPPATPSTTTSSTRSGPAAASVPEPPPQRVPGRPDHRPGARRRRQGPHHPGRRHAHAGRHDRDRCAVLHAVRLRRVEPGPEQLGAASCRAGQGPARRRGGRADGRWNHSYPTGIPEGYDAADRDGRLGPPSPDDIDNSAAATLFTLWRGRFVVNVFDRHLRPSRRSCRCPVTSRRGQGAAAAAPRLRRPRASAGPASTSSPCPVLPTPPTAATSWCSSASPTP